jgi:transcriptional regulator with XRE-family HTH domain
MAERGLTQTGLAKRMGVSKSVVHYLVCGASDPRLSTLVRCATALRMPVAKLLSSPRRHRMSARQIAG